MAASNGAGPNRCRDSDGARRDLSGRNVKAFKPNPKILQGHPRSRHEGRAMTCEQFVETSFQAKSLAVIEQANTIIAEHQAQGFELTLRQLFYQFVTRDLMENSTKAYKRLGSIIRNGRNSGLIDWDAIEDRTRAINTHASWESPAEIIGAVGRQYCEDLWRNMTDFTA